MSEKLVEEATKFRDQIPELEGILIGKLDGTKVWADTLKDANHEFILTSASVVVRATKKLSESIEKKIIKEIDAEIEGGFITILVSDNAIIVGYFGEDARSQLGIIKKNLRMFASKIQEYL
ncbi:MAG: hypothetical protein ACFFDW_11245 [Candidatus Thorarchaeota archaeon]